MNQVVQNLRGGKIGVRDIPDPIAIPNHVVVASVCSAVSVGTERYVVELARKSLAGKAMERPDHVRRVWEKVRQEGLRSTLTQVRGKLAEPLPLGYSSAGIVLECGRGVQEFKPGDRVATVAPHAGVVSVPKNLCVRIPSGVAFDSAAYSAVASIALEGVRLARVELGARVLVIGLGLIGQICVSLLKAQGCRVFGTDVDTGKLKLALEFGADEVALGRPLPAVMAFSDSFGVDAVIIAASTASNEPIEFAAEACRQKGRVVLVGMAGTNVPRPPFFAKELEFTVSFSIGPGRTDPNYEDKGVDYPIGYARWTAKRNMQTALELMASGKIPADKLTTHRFPVERAAEAYELITGNREPILGLLLDYSIPPERPARRVTLHRNRAADGQFGVSLIGAGNFARLMMLPILTKIPNIDWRGLCTAKGLNSEDSGRKMNFGFATTDIDEIWNDAATKAVFIATRHDLHAELAIAALRAGKHVFVEKPLCISPDELTAVTACIEELGDACPVLMVGFNRRFANATARMRRFFGKVAPLSLSYRFAPGHIPANHWTQDEDLGGGRIVGEACHAIDTCVALCGSVPVKVYAESVDKTGGLETSDDHVFITLRHENGSISNISYQAAGDRAFPPERIEIFGGGRTGVIDGWDAVQLWSGNRSEKAGGKKDKGHAAEMAEFIRVCREGGPWPIPWGDLYGVSWASLMAVRSLREGRPIYRD